MSVSVFLSRREGQGGDSQGGNLARTLALRFRDWTMAVAATWRPWALFYLAVAALLFPGAAGECMRVW